MCRNILYYGGKGADVMRQKELVFRFHNPNSEKATYNALAKIFTEIGCRKLKKAISDSQKEKDKSSMDNEQAFI